MLSILLFKIVATAMAMIIVPRTIHIIVQCFDDLYEMLGRRARSPWETQTLWGYGAFAALVIMLFLHDTFSRLSSNVILNEDLEKEWARQNKYGNRSWKERKVTWERILVKMVIPMLVMGFFVSMAWGVIWAVEEFVTANTVDLEDDAKAGLVWKDR